MILTLFTCLGRPVAHGRHVGPQTCRVVFGADGSTQAGEGKMTRYSSLSRRATHVDQEHGVPEARTVADFRNAQPTGGGSCAGVGQSRRGARDEWPAEPTCPTVELPCCDKVAPVAKSRAKWDSVAWQEIGVAIFAVLMVILVSVAGR